MALTETQLSNMYRDICRIRQFEEQVVQLYAGGEIPGFVHIYHGEEGVAVGACAALRRDDYITSTHRGHGHCIAKGGRLDKMMAELFARATGYCRGKGGSMHIADLESGILGANGIVGGGIPIATGAALAAQYQGTDQVCLCFFGDGASNQGSFHESLNLAAVWKLPCIYVCENNFYAETTPQRDHQAITDIADRAKAYNIPSAIADGNDALDVYEKVSAAVQRARAGGGPTLVECKTYRWRGHWEGDPEVYRTDEEVALWRQRDPLKRLETYLTSHQVLSTDELADIRRQVADEVARAVAFARESPQPPLESALEDVFTA